MSKIKQFFRQHWAVIGLAIFTSVIIALPQIYFRVDHREVYQGIELLPDSPWSARVREIQDGHGFGSIYFKEGKNDPYLFQPLGSYTVATLGKIFSLDINNTILLSRLVLPFFTVLLFYCFVYLFSRDRLLALSHTALILLASPILGVFGVKQLLRGVSPSSFLELARPVNSAMIFIPYLAFLVALWLFYQRRHWGWGVLSAIILGLNFYTYFYTWTYLYASGSILVLFCLLRWGWREALRLSTVFLGGVVVAIPYMINLYLAGQHPNYEEVAIRYGLVVSHLPLFVGFSVAIALVVYLIGFPREDRQRYFFGLSLLLAPFITMNQQVLTGKILQVGHYHWYFHKPMAVLMVMFVVFYFLKMKGLIRYRQVLAAVLVLGSMATGVYIQAWSYYIDDPTRDGGEIAIERQKYGPVMRWLSANGAKESVVFANEEASHITVIYTPLNVFYQRAAHYSLVASHRRMLDILFTYYRLRGVGKKDVREVFYKERRSISTILYGVYYRDVTKSNYEAIPDAKLDELVALYESSLAVPKDKWLQQIWKKYEVEYIVWDKKKDPLWQLDSFPYLEKAAEFGVMEIYRFN